MKIPNPILILGEKNAKKDECLLLAIAKAELERIVFKKWQYFIRSEQAYLKISKKGCWIWNRARFKQKKKCRHDYGAIRIKIGVYGIGTTVQAHRYFYELIKGKIRKGLVLDHLCKNPPCCNPNHLEPVTPAENVRRGSQASKRFCVRGHELSGNNLYKRKNKPNVRICIACSKLRAKGIGRVGKDG